jgi:hydroxymethylpyrimidine/phosphomethylpyrimidine kinase
LNSRLARLLIIAGSDSSGGAGIQADLKTATALGVYAMTAITAVTVQDTTRVHAIHHIPAFLIRDQIACVLADIGADAIKIGMLGEAGAIEAVADALFVCASDIPIVLDPVLASTSGTHLLHADAIASLKAHLFPRATLLTPNIPESEILSGVTIRGDEDIVRAAGALRALGPDAVLVKGGHATDARVRDFLVSGDGVEVYEQPRVPAGSTHGTGCTLATAIACGLARGNSLIESVHDARRFVQAALATAPSIGHGNKPLNHLHAFGRQD